MSKLTRNGIDPRRRAKLRSFDAKLYLSIKMLNECIGDAYQAIQEQPKSEPSAYYHYDQIRETYVATAELLQNVEKSRRLVAFILEHPKRMNPKYYESKQQEAEQLTELHNTNQLELPL